MRPNRLRQRSGADLSGYPTQSPAQGQSLIQDFLESDSSKKPTRALSLYGLDPAFDFFTHCRPFPSIDSGNVEVEHIILDMKIISCKPLTQKGGV